MRGADEASRKGFGQRGSRLPLGLQDVRARAAAPAGQKPFASGGTTVPPLHSPDYRLRDKVPPAPPRRTDQMLDQSGSRRRHRCAGL